MGALLSVTPEFIMNIQQESLNKRLSFSQQEAAFSLTLENTRRLIIS